MKFKVGDKVKCIRDHGFSGWEPQLGRVFTVSRCDNDYDVELAGVDTPHGYPLTLRSDRFILIETAKVEAPKKEGVKYDDSKPMMALIPAEALEEEAWVWTFGAKKYGNWNWCKGLVYTRILSAMFRHLIAIMMDQDTDPESGKLHAAHIRCCAGMLIYFHKHGRLDLDDRNKSGTQADKK